MKKILLFFYSVVVCHCLFSQTGSTNEEVRLKAHIDSINRQVDIAVVSKDLQTLKKTYAEDFVFTHGTGRVDSKQSWIKSVSDTGTRYIARKNDSTIVELHGNVAIVKGKLTVHRPQNGRNGYSLWYIRVYAVRQEGWQMLSHRTISETMNF